VSLAPRPMLAGREGLLADLHVRLSDGADPFPRTVALYGLGGAGKTSVALEYAHRRLPEIGLAWQVSCQHPEILLAEFGRLAAQLGARDVVDARDPVASVHSVLAAFPEDWLLVFDDAPDLASVQQFLPPIGKGCVLITSRSALWASVRAIEVPTLNLQVAAGFLMRRTSDPAERAAAELADELGGLPLALEQAAAYMRATGHTIADYLALFRERRGELLARGQVDGYNKTVATTWSVALQGLQEVCPGAVALLRLMAWYAPDQIPVRLLLNPGTQSPEFPDTESVKQLLPLLADSLAADDALTALQRFSLVSGPIAGNVSVHRLVQMVTSGQLSQHQRDAWRHAAGVLVNAVMPENPYEPGSWPTYATLLPHARTALPPESPGMGNLTRYLIASGDYRTAHVIGEQVLASRQRLHGDNNRETLQAMTDLGFAQRRLGEFESARQLLQKAVRGCRGVLGDDAPDTLIARYGLGWVLRDLGHWDEAETELRVVLRLQEQQLGDQHHDCLTTRRALASVLRRQGRLIESETEFRAVLDGRRQVLGDGHPDTLISRHDLAYILQQRGRLQNAEAEYRAAHETQLQVLGEGHPSALITQQNLAALLQERGRWDEAEQQYQAVFEGRQRVLGERHPETLDSRHALAYVLQARGRLDAAEAEYRAIIDVQCQVLGQEHPGTLGTRRNLAALLQERGRWDEAEQQYQAVFEGRQKALGDDHPDTRASHQALAYVIQQRP
jgi:tetratricopeptide (TPR) repeat protein